MARGRYCVKSSDGWWLLLERGSSCFVENPEPPSPPTSFFGKAAALEALRREALPYLGDLLEQHKVADYDALRASGFEGVVWAVVPDPNP